MTAEQSISTRVAEGIRSVPGVAGLYAPRPAAIEAARSVAASVAGTILGVPETGADVVVDVGPEVAAVRVDIAAAADHRAADLARAVAGEVRTLLAVEAPGLPVEVTVRIASVDS